MSSQRIQTNSARGRARDRARVSSALELTDAALQALIDKHAAERSLARLSEEYELRERFISLLSHDLRIPLTTARLSAQLIHRDSACTPSISKTADRIVHAVDRANAMIASLLDAHRLRGGGVLPLNLTEGDLSQALLDAHAGLSTDHALLCGLDLGSDPVHGMWDISAIRRGVENLIHNGIKYGEYKGRVSVRLSAADGVALISVHNRGGELSAEQQAKLFQWGTQIVRPGQTANPGWGLGLMLVKAAAESHGGRVEVISAPELGTTFTLRLPIRVTR